LDKKGGNRNVSLVLEGQGRKYSSFVIVATVLAEINAFGEFSKLMILWKDREDRLSIEPYLLMA
jgi:hypothetical protein